MIIASKGGSLFQLSTLAGEDQKEIHPKCALPYKRVTETLVTGDVLTITMQVSARSGEIW